MCAAIIGSAHTAPFPLRLLLVILLLDDRRNHRFTILMQDYIFHVPELRPNLTGTDEVHHSVLEALRQLHELSNRANNVLLEEDSDPLRIGILLSQVELQSKDILSAMELSCEALCQDLFLSVTSPLLS
jgi:hypothetical protein